MPEIGRVTIVHGNDYEGKYSTVILASVLDEDTFCLNITGDQGPTRLSLRDVELLRDILDQWAQSKRGGN